MFMRVFYFRRCVLRSNRQMFDVSITVFGVGTDTKQNKTWPWTQGEYETLDTVLGTVGNQRKLNLKLRELKI